MKPYYSDSTALLYHGDALDVLRELGDVSVDAVCTDPPYGLEFLGREWDSFRPTNARLRTRVDQRTNPATGKSVTTTPEAYVAGTPYQMWCQEWATECLRILKPGAFLLAFGGTRTVHRLACAIEDAGFEIRDGIDWIYAQGFPKSLNVGNGRGTALKPAREPIVVARKPLATTVVANVLEYGTGALNIDVCRIAASEPDGRSRSRDGEASRHAVFGSGDDFTLPPGPRGGAASGRWPANVILSHAATRDGVDLCADGCVPGCPVAELDAQSGDRPSMGRRPLRRGVTTGKGLGFKADVVGATGVAGYDDAGGASRYFPAFRYEAKAPTTERPKADGEGHPTVKPLDLMRWLVRLVTPSGGLVVDPFVGSGTTAEACAIEGFRCIAAEREAAYLPLIVTRLSKPLQPALDLPIGGVR